MKELVKTFLQRVDASVEEIETDGFPIIYAHLDSEKEKTLTFYNHYDVQPEVPVEQWLSDPFKADIRNGQIFARGVADNKGNLIARICYVELICKGAKFDLHSSEAAIIENPAWRLIWALNSLKDEQENILIEGFYDDVISLSEKDRIFIQSMDFNEEEIKKLYGIKSFLKNVTGNELKETLTAEPTCTICGINSGYTGEGTKTVLPSTAMVKLDFRLVPNQTPEKIADLLRKHLDKSGFHDIEIRQSHGIHPFNTDPSNRFVEVVLESVDQVYVEPPVILRNLAGSSPMYKMLKNTGIPAVQIGVANLQSNYHAPNENIFIDDYIQGIKVTAAVMKNFSQ
ncbi:M20/M25/M40 family metallo-hydrolase [Cytobacillus oceanisediminis]